jgi:hypothetical protein
MVLSSATKILGFNLPMLLVIEEMITTLRLLHNSLLQSIAKEKCSMILGLYLIYQIYLFNRLGQSLFY